MKILNICISAPYTEGFSYQENLLTDYFMDAGIDSPIVSSNILPGHLGNKKINRGIYFDKEKKIIRINCYKISTEFIIPIGLYRQIKKEEPDVIFHHNLNCTSLLICTIYRLIHPKIVLLVDNHADYINCSKNKLWQLLYYRFLVRLSAKLASFFVKKFYGVTHSRCDYLRDVYGIKKELIDFLPIGADVKKANLIKENKKTLREKFQIPNDAFVFVSGGKMGVDKGTDLLIRAICNIHKKKGKVFLVLFGSFNDEITGNLSKMSSVVINMGWRDHIDILGILKLSDVAVWPVHHTTLVEDAIAVKTPVILRRTDTTKHLINGNGLFLESLEYNELYSKIEACLKLLPNDAVKIACNEMRNTLDYAKIAQKVIDDIKLK